jgi:hypothetical protein
LHDGILMSDAPSSPSNAAPPPPPRVDPTPPPKLPPPNAPKEPSRPPIRLPATVSLAALLIVALALVGTAPFWAPPLMPLLPWSTAPTQTEPQTNPAQEQMAQQLAAIRQQLDQLSNLDNRIKALESKPAPDASAAIAPLASQVQQLDARIDQIDKLMVQLTRDAATNAESPQRVLMISLASLGNAIAGSRPFSAELVSVEALGRNRPGWAAALQPLEAAAKTGIPSLAVLTQRFSDDVAPAILRAQANAPNSKQGLGEAMLTRLKSLVVIRRVDGGNSGGGDPTERAVSEAQAALNKSDLAGAAKALGALNGPAANAAQPWLKDAQERLDAEQTIAKLSRDIAGELAAGPSGG